MPPRQRALVLNAVAANTENTVRALAMFVEHEDSCPDNLLSPLFLSFLPFPARMMGYSSEFVKHSVGTVVTYCGACVVLTLVSFWVLDGPRLR